VVKVMLLVHALDIGGAELGVVQLARHLRRCGDTVEIGCLGELGALGEDVRQELDVVVHARRPGFDRTLPWRLAQHIRRTRVDVVHAHQRTAFFYGVLSGILHTTPIVYTEHGPWFGPPPSALQVVFNRVLGWRAGHITAVSRDVKRALGALEGFAGRDIAVVPNAIDVARVAAGAPGGRDAARRRFGLPLHAPILGTVGRLDPVKNHRLLVHVVARLRRRLPNALLVLVGDGPERTALETLVRERSAGDAVRLLGVQRDVERILPAFDVFALSSLSEGIPLSLLEAMAAGVPVVATAVGGIPEAARAGEDALLVDGTPSEEADYVERFATAVEHLLRNPASARRLAESAAQRVRQEFDLDVVYQRYRDILAAAVG
jgi:glycosyltransferase involved in cell wall biosynthesis